MEPVGKAERMAERSSLLVTSPSDACNTVRRCILVMNRNQKDEKNQYRKCLMVERTVVLFIIYRTRTRIFFLFAQSADNNIFYSIS